MTKIFLSRYWQSFSRRLARARRRSKFKVATLDFYVRVNDPYCMMVLPKLAPLCQIYQVKLNPIILYELPVPHFHERQLKDTYSIQDVSDIAKILNIPLPTPNLFEPNHRHTWLATRILLRNQSTENFLNIAEAVFESLWTGNHKMLKQYAMWHNTVTSEESRIELTENKQKLIKLGQTSSGMMYFDGEWYWGFDRLHHLEERLRKERNPLSSPVWKYPPDIQLQEGMDLRHQIVKLFFSYDCPYCYLAIQQLIQLSQHYGFQIQFIPVQLPQQPQVPTTHSENRWLRLLDVSREARKKGIAFGKLVDITENTTFDLYAIHFWAEKQGKLLPWITRATAATWAEGNHFHSRAALKKFTMKCLEISSETFEGILKEDSSRKKIKKNYQHLLEIGFWDIPTIQCQDFITWGQDRIWHLEYYLTTQHQRIPPHKLPVKIEEESNSDD